MASLLGHVTDEAGVELDYLPYPAPQPLEHLWTRPDLGCVFMCGYPIALGLADVEPSPPRSRDAAWAQGRRVYRSDLIVRRDAPVSHAGGHIRRHAGWTVSTRIPASTPSAITCCAT